MNLSEKVQEYIEKQPAGHVILATDVVDNVRPIQCDEEREKKIRQNVYVILTRLLQKEENLKRYDIGIYYRIDETINDVCKTSLINRLFIENTPGEICGYFSGETISYVEGYRTKKPPVLEIVSNYWRRKADVDFLGIQVTAPIIEVTTQNVKLLQLLDIFKWNPKLVKDEEIRKKTVGYILENDMDTMELMSLAVQHSNQKIVLCLAQLIPHYLEAQKEFLTSTVSP